MFVLLLTAQAKNFSSELTKMDFFLPGTLHVCMIRNLQPNYALTPPKHLSFSVSVLVLPYTFISIPVSADLIPKHKRTSYPRKIRRIISMCKWITGIPLKDLYSVKYNNCSFCIPSLDCFCITHMGQYTVIHLRFNGKVRNLCIFSSLFQHIILSSYLSGGSWNA